jgi:hypothetical protein
VSGDKSVLTVSGDDVSANCSSFLEIFLLLCVLQMRLVM